jgi:hypothetical protein
MKAGRNLTELAQEIERQQKSKKDYIADTSALVMITLDGATRLALNTGELFPIRANAHAQIGERVGIPAKYYDRMLKQNPVLLAHNVNTWLHQDTERRMVRTLDGEVRAFLSDRYQRIDNWNVANVVLPELMTVPGLTVRSCEITESRLYIKATSTAITGEVKSKRVGDVVEAGVMISNSEVGLGRVSVKPYMNFLVCLNGMVRDSVLAVAHIGRKIDDVDGLLSDETKKAEDSVILMKVRDVLKSAFDAAAFQRAIQKMDEQTHQLIKGDVVKSIELLGDTVGLNEGERSGVLFHLIQGGDLSRFGVMNAVTRFAADVESYDRATELEAAGGSVLDMPQGSWERIAVAA